MTMTLWQVRDRLRAVDSNGMSGDVCDELADAIDAHIAGMGEPVAWQQKRDPKDYPDEWRECIKEVFDMISRTPDSPWVARELFASPPIDLAAVREVIAELRSWDNAYPGVGGLANKLEAAMPKEAK